MNKILSIGILLFVLIVLIGVTSASSVSTLNVPTKYKTHIYINNYYESDSYYSYSDGQYIWLPKKSSFSNPAIRENYSGSQTKIKFYTYNNNGNRYHWTDVRSSQITVKYKIITDIRTYYCSNTFKYTKIPKYGMTKTLFLKGPTGNVLIYYMKWIQVQRFWYRG